MSAPKKTKFEIAVSDKVKEMRVEKGFSQEYIAGLLQLTTGFIGQVESPNHPRKYNLNHFCMGTAIIQGSCSDYNFGY